MVVFLEENKYEWTEWNCEKSNFFVISKSEPNFFEVQYSEESCRCVSCSFPTKTHNRHYHKQCILFDSEIFLTFIVGCSGCFPFEPESWSCINKFDNFDWIGIINFIWIFVVVEKNDMIGNAFGICLPFSIIWSSVVSLRISCSMFQ